VRRALSVGLAVLMAVGVAAAIFVSVTGGGKDAGGDLTEVRGVIGSEKQPFFRDPAVVKAFAAHGLKVAVDTAGSRDIASSTDLSKYDFAFPAGAQAAPPIKRKLKATREYGPFQTPMAIATFTEIAEVLQKAGVAKPIDGAKRQYWRFDVKAYLDLVKRDTRWIDVPGNKAYPARKSVLVSSTDVRTSNSAALYLAIASYVANSENVVAGSAKAVKIAREVAPLFVRQGYTEASTEGPFEDYLAIGAGKTPMVMVYESQFLARRASGDGSIRPGMVLMYPGPDIVTRHTLIPRTAAGDRVGRLLTEDPELQRLAARNGYRPRSQGALEKYLISKRVPVPPALVDVVEPPTYATLETMIKTITTQIDAPVPKEQDR